MDRLRRVASLLFWLLAATLPVLAAYGWTRSHVVVEAVERSPGPSPRFPYFYWWAVCSVRGELLIQFTTQPRGDGPFPPRAVRSYVCQQEGDPFGRQGYRAMPEWEFAPARLQRLGFRASHWSGGARPGHGTFELKIPYWSVVMLTAAPFGLAGAGWAVRRARMLHRAFKGRCAHCGYDLRGSRYSGRCPECGELTLEPKQADVMPG